MVFFSPILKYVNGVLVRGLSVHLVGITATGRRSEIGVTRISGLTQRPRGPAEQQGDLSKDGQLQWLRLFCGLLQLAGLWLVCWEMLVVSALGRSGVPG